MASRNSVIGLVAGVALGSMSAGNAADVQQTGKPGVGFGEPIAEEAIEPWSISIHAPSGEGLPEGEGTVDQGREIYNNQCAACHGEEAEGGPMYGTMVGGIDSFETDERVLTPGSMYPYAPILFDYTHRTMPMDHPQSLNADEVYAVSAYLLYLNELLDEDETLDAETMAELEMPNRDGFIEADQLEMRDVEAVRCMSNCPEIRGIGD